MSDPQHPADLRAAEMGQAMGQGKTAALLRKSLSDGRLSHAYLFLGPRREDCKALALWLAQALNCAGDVPPCGECASCARIASGLHADVQLITVAESRGSSEGNEDGPAQKGIIGIKRIQALLHDASFQPYEGRQKVFIIAEAERLTAEASNCLLKTLEEPPPGVTLILITPSEGLLLPTLLSRCQRITLDWLPPMEVERRLQEDWAAPPERARLLARLCGGSLSWAVSALQEERLLEPRAQRLEYLRHMLEEGLEQRFALASELATRFGRQREMVPEWFDTWLSWWRDVLIIKGGVSQGIANWDEESSLVEEAEATSLEDILSVIKGLKAARDRIEANASIRLVLENLMFDLPPPRGRKEERGVLV